MSDIALQYNPYVVLLSMLTGVFCTYAALAALTRSRLGRGWLWLSALAFGLGVWATHFTALSGIETSILPAYNLPLSLLSGLTAALAMFLALSWAREGTVSTVGGGLILGLGVAASDYLGVLSLVLPGTPEVQWPLLLAALLGAVFLTTVAVWFLETSLFRGLKRRIAAVAVFLGFTVAFTGYTTVLAIRFVAPPAFLPPLMPLSGLSPLIPPMIALVGLTLAPWLLFFQPGFEEVPGGRVNFLIASILLPIFVAGGLLVLYALYAPQFAAPAVSSAALASWLTSSSAPQAIPATGLLSLNLLLLVAVGLVGLPMFLGSVVDPQEEA